MKTVCGIALNEQLEKRIHIMPSSICTQGVHGATVHTGECWQHMSSLPSSQEQRDWQSAEACHEKVFGHCTAQ